jgi:cyclophilin family peptidyl-prolyl cis-trans isomerase
VVPGFVIQGGDPTGTGTGGPGYEFDDELPPSADAYTPGVVAMANSGADTNGSQFFVVLGDIWRAAADYSVFGKVTSGMDTTIPAIAALGTSEPGTPTEPVDITTVKITER